MTTRILVVEDDIHIARLLCYQLDSAGYEVVRLVNGLEALSHLDHDTPDLVLLDVMMPEMSGWDVCRQIRACSAVPIIMLTAKSADNDVVTGLTAGADDYVTKPFSMVQLLARVEAVLRRTARPEPHTSNNTRNLVQVARRPMIELSRPAEPTLHIQATTQASESEIKPLGRQLYEARASQGVTLHQAARDCGVRWDFLQALEQEHFAYLPRNDLRHSLRSYSDYLRLDLYALTGRRRPRRFSLDALALRQPLPLAAVTVALLVILLVGVVLL